MICLFFLAACTVHKPLPPIDLPPPPPPQIEEWIRTGTAFGPEQEGGPAKMWYATGKTRDAEGYALVDAYKEMAWSVTWWWHRTGIYCQLNDGPRVPREEFEWPE